MNFMGDLLYIAFNSLVDKLSSKKNEIKLLNICSEMSFSLEIITQVAAANERLFSSSNSPTYISSY